MAVEAVVREYLYVPNNCASDPPGFFHNALHDLESLWWIAVWQLFSRRCGLKTDLEDGGDEDHASRRDAALYLLFPGRDVFVDRWLFFKSKGNFLGKLSWLSDDLLGVVEEQEDRQHAGGDRRRRVSPRAGPLPGDLRGRLRCGQHRGAADRRVLHHPPLLALDLLHQPAYRRPGFGHGADVPRPET